MYNEFRVGVIFTKYFTIVNCREVTKLGGKRAKTMSLDYWASICYTFWKYFYLFQSWKYLYLIRVREVLILTVYCSFYMNAAGFCIYIFVILRWHETKSFVDRSGFKSNILFLLLKLQMIYISKIVYFILKIIPLKNKRVQPSISITKSFK